MRTVIIGCWLAMSACGTAGPDNVTTCQKFVDAAKCGSVDLSDTFDCSTYDVGDCDLSPYFNCLSMHYMCVNGQYDSTAMMGINTCTSFANCN
jgi:hypothetical protein